MPYQLEKPERLELTKAYKLLEEADEMCKRAANCGFNMEAADLACQALRERVDAIMREFGPRRKE